MVAEEKENGGKSLLRTFLYTIGIIVLLVVLFGLILFCPFIGIPVAIFACIFFFVRAGQDIDKWLEKQKK